MVLPLGYAKSGTELAHGATRGRGSRVAAGPDNSFYRRHALEGRVTLQLYRVRPNLYRMCRVYAPKSVLRACASKSVLGHVAMAVWRAQ
eukprot:1512127-Rhodomonas_salina.1